MNQFHVKEIDCRDCKYARDCLNRLSAPLDAEQPESKLKVPLAVTLTLLHPPNHPK